MFNLLLIDRALEPVDIHKLLQMREAFFALCILAFASCTDDLKDKQIRVNIRVENKCGPLAEPLDSTDIVMEFVDKDGKKIVDADVVTRSPADDTNFHFRTRLKDSDKWRIKRVQGGDGETPCNGCMDTLDFGTCQLWITSKNEFVPVDSPAIFRAICTCR